MKNFNLSFTAREIHSEPSYSPMEEYGLQYTYNTSSGEGTSNSPYCCNISITNKNAAPWEGVLHIAMKQKRFDPQIFMPGFMYGTNRGDMPMEGLRACPKIRKELSKPASPWWMVRGDRLSHPTALVADNNRIYGFHASPYWTTNNNTKCSALGRDHDFLQYAGFTCNAYTQIQDNTEYYCEVGYTIGYENAPWLFIESQDVRDRAPLKEQCIYLDTQETIHFTM